MRKLIKIAASAVGLFSLFLAGCSDIDSDDSATVSGGANSASSTKEITLSVSAKSDLVNFEAEDTSLSANVARNISPKALDSGSLKFYYDATNIKTNENVGVREVTFTPVDDAGEVITTAGTTSKKGKVKIDVNPAQYRFTLIACLSDNLPPTNEVTGNIDNIVKYAVLIAYADADLRYTSTVNFNLTAEGLNGTSKAKLKFYRKGWTEAQEQARTTTAADSPLTMSSIDVYIADLMTKTRKFPVASDGSLIDLSDNAEEAKAKEVSWAIPDTVGTGTFNLVFEFQVSGKKFSYTTLIDLLTNQTTEAVVPVMAVFDSKPKAPTNFKVGYVEPESTDVEAQYYKAIFNWKDESDNEDYFEIQLKELTDNTAFTNDATGWGTTDGTSYKDDFYGNTEKNWYAGSLLTNNEEAVFYLPLGKKYAARIRAHNEYDDSDWCYSTAAATTFKTTCVDREKPKSSTVHTFEAKAFTNTNVINLYKIRYHFNGGTAIPSGITENNVYFFEQIFDSATESSGVAIMYPNSETEAHDENEKYDSGKKILLKRGDATWVNWIVGSSVISDTNKYPDVFTAASGNAATTTTYYQKDGTNTDLNYRQAYVVPTTQPASGAPMAANTYFTSAGIPASYRGWKNLDLYANYTETSASVEIRNIDDYNIQYNLDISIIGVGNPSDYTSQNVITRDTTTGLITEKQNLEYYLIEKTITTTGSDTTTSVKKLSSVKITCTPVSGGKTYDDIFIRLNEQGGDDIATVSGTNTGSGSKEFTIPVSNLKPGTYVAHIFATTSATNGYREYNLFIKISDEKVTTTTGGGD